QRALFYALAAFFVLCGVGFLFCAAYIAAAQRIGIVHAAIWFGVGFLVLAALMLLIAKITASVRVRRNARRRGAEARALAGTAALALVPVLLSRSPLLALAPFAALLGYGIYRENSGSEHKKRD